MSHFTGSHLAASSIFSHLCLAARGENRAAGRKASAACGSEKLIEKIWADMK